MAIKVRLSYIYPNWWGVLFSDDNGVFDDDQEPLLVTQTDYDYPAVAIAFGWDIRKVHRRSCKQKSSTDGSVDCSNPRCKPASSFISSAYDYLEKCYLELNVSGNETFEAWLDMQAISNGQPNKRD